MRGIHWLVAAMALVGVGLLWGALGVLGFSFTLPATRLAVADLDGTVDPYR